MKSAIIILILGVAAYFLLKPKTNAQGEKAPSILGGLFSSVYSGSMLTSSTSDGSTSTSDSSTSTSSTSTTSTSPGGRTSSSSGRRSFTNQLTRKSAFV
jgi:hypothetical protein